MRLFSSFFLFVAYLSAAPVDWIWSARYVITMDAQHRVIENGAVAIKGDRIIGVGTKAEIDARVADQHVAGRGRVARHVRDVPPAALALHTTRAIDGDARYLTLCLGVPGNRLHAVLFQLVRNIHHLGDRLIDCINRPITDG